MRIKKALEEGIRLNKEHVTGKQNDVFLLSCQAAEGVDVSEVVWESSNTDVATVDANGLVKIVLSNNRNAAVITATAKSGEKASCNVYVHNNYYDAISTRTHFFDNKNDSEQLLQYMYSDDNGATFKHYSQNAGAWLDNGAVTGRVQSFQMQGKPGVWATIAYKAPYAGTLGIYYNGGCSVDSDVDFKIVKNSQKVYPVGMDYLEIRQGSDDITEYVYDNNTILCLPGLTLDNPTEYMDKWAEGLKVEVNAGDYIYLMAKSENSGSLVNWNRGFEFMYDDYETERYIEMPQTVVLKSRVPADVSVTEMSGEAVCYYSSDKSVALVDENGFIKAAGNGRCNVYAVSDDGMGSSCEVAVELFDISKLNDGCITVVANPGSAEKAVVIVVVKDKENRITDIKISEEKTIGTEVPVIFEVKNIVKSAEERAFLYIWDSLKPVNNITEIY